ncbi:MAG: hypothetical protein KKB75_14405 [Alphaproteobacteria bacterium]|nr:hypothetical protein [Alphaproteobacteria bacterium]MBU2197874.1 hypothetical protein [Alphaproteobacteria bacterium]
MNIKFLVPTVAALGLLTTVSGCTTAVGAAGSALAGSAASGMLASGGNKARFSRQSCDELEKEVAGAQRSMMNPTNIPFARSYIKDVKEVAAEKECAFVATDETEVAETDAEAETETPATE